MKRLTFERIVHGLYYIYNRKKESLGEIYFKSDWKCFVWEQDRDIVMSEDCLKEIVDFMKKEGDKLK